MHPFLFQIVLDLKKRFSLIISPKLVKNDYLGKLTVCSYHVTYVFQSESTLYSCLGVKEILARNRHEIGSLRDCSWTRTHNHIVCKCKWLIFLPINNFYRLFFQPISFLPIRYKNQILSKHNLFPLQIIKKT